MAYKSMDRVVINATMQYLRHHFLGAYNGPHSQLTAPIREKQCSWSKSKVSRNVGLSPGDTDLGERLVRAEWQSPASQGAPGGAVLCGPPGQM